MKREIEKKFLLKNDSWKREVIKNFHLEQFYIGSISGKTFRTRKQTDLFINYILTIKVATDEMGDNIEIEHFIPKEMFDLLNSDLKNKFVLIENFIIDKNVDWEINEINKIRQESSNKELSSLDPAPIYSISKIRNIIERDGVVWEIDEFEGLNKGLVMAEIELKSKEQYFIKPEWLGEEVTEDKRYYNGYLSKNKVV